MTSDYKMTDRVQTEAESLRQQVAAAQQELAYMRQLVATTSEQALMLDAEGRCLEVFALPDTALPGGAEQVRGKHVQDILPAEQSETLLALLHQALATQQPATGHANVRTSDSDAWYAITLFPLDTTRAGCRIQDITEQKRNEYIEQQQASYIWRCHRVLERLIAAQQAPVWDGLALLAEANELALPHLHADRASVWLRADGQDVLECADSYDAHSQQHMSGMVLHAADYPSLFQALADEHIISVENVATDARTAELAASAHLPGGPVAALLAVSLHLGGTNVGLVLYEQYDTPRQWSPEAWAFAASMAGLLLLVVESRNRRRTETALRESQALLGSILDHVPMAIDVSDQEGRYLLANTRMLHLLRRTSQEVIGKQLSELMPPELHALTEADIRQVRETGKAVEREVLLRNGETTYTLMNITFPIYDANGEVRAFGGIANDITRHKQAEESLQQSQKLLQQRTTELETQMEELSMLTHITRTVANVSDLNDALNVVARMLTELFRARNCGIGLFNTNQTRLRVTVEYGLHDDGTSTVGMEIPVQGNPLISRLLTTAVPLVLEDVPNNPLTVQVRDLLHIWDTQCLMLIPLLARDEMLGTIGIGTDQPGRVFQPEEVHLAETITSQIAGIIEKARLYEDVLQATEQLKILTAASLSISAASSDIQQVYTTIYETVSRLMPVDAFVIELIQPEQEQVEVRSITAPNEPWEPVYQELASSLAGYMLRQNCPLRINDFQTFVGPELTFRELEHPETINAGLGVLMRSGEHTLGILFVQSHQRGAYTPGDQELLELLAIHAAVAIENVRLFSEQQHQRQVAESLQQVATIVNASLDRTVVFTTIMEQLAHVMDFDGAAVFLLDEDDLVIAHVARSEDRRFVGTRVPTSGTDPAARIFRDRTPLIINDVAQDPHWEVWPEGKPIRSWIGVPFFVSDRIIGVLVADHNMVGNYTHNDATIMQAFASHAAVAIENARLFSEQQQQRQISDILRRVATIINTSLDRTIVLDKIMEQLQYVLVYNGAAVFLVDGDDLVLSVASGVRGTDFIGTRIPLSNKDPAVRVFRQRRPHIIADLHEDPDWDMWPGGEPIRSWIGVPLFVGDRLIGTLAADHYIVDWYTSDDALVLQTFASHAAVAIENSRLYQQIRREKRLSEALIENTPVAILTTDLEARVASWNPAAEKLFQYRLSEALDRPLSTLIADVPEIYEEAVAFDQQTIAGVSVQKTTRRTRKDGSFVDVELLGLPVHLDGQQVGYISLYYDITELLRARQEAEAANQAKSTFLANMSHELRTPLTAVIGMTELMLDTDLDDEQQEYVETIHTSGNALLLLINDILDFSKIEAGRMELESKPFDLHRCVEEAVDLVAAQADKKNLELNLRFAPDLPVIMQGDVARLRQVLLNLLSNAVKFTHQGEVVIEVASEPLVDSEPDSTTSSYEPIPVILYFSVRDNGIGIPEDRLTQIFDSFSQGDASTTRAYGGTGLGLAITKRLVELMDGVMRVESIVGRGSTFSFTIRSKHLPGSQRAYLRGVDPTLAQRQLLVVDDSLTTRAVVQQYTGMWGMQSHGVASASEALAWARQNPACHMVLIDRTMPEIDGIALAQMMRDEGLLPSALFVLLNTLRYAEQRPDPNLFHVVLNKPVKLASLYEVLTGVVKRSTTQRLRRPAGKAIAQQTGQENPLRILLAEDNQLNQMVITRLLDRIGYKAEVVENGREVLEALEREIYDVVLMDVQMPEMDGEEATRRIRQQVQPARQPSIIALTANAFVEDRERYLQAGMDEYLSKPIQITELTETLRRCQPITPRGEEVAATPALDLDLIDWEVLNEYAELFEDDEREAELNDLIDLFATHTPPLLERIAQALEQGRMAEVAEAAHEMVTTSATVGAYRLAELARQLQHAARESELAAATALQAEMHQLFTQSVLVLTNRWQRD